MDKRAQGIAHMLKLIAQGLREYARVIGVIGPVERVGEGEELPAEPVQGLLVAPVEEYG